MNWFLDTLWGSLKEFERQICENAVFSILDYVECFNYKLTRACDLEHDNLKKSQDKMKHRYNKDAMVRELKPDEKVIVLLLTPCHPLPVKYVWPYAIESRLKDLNYIVNTPTRRKKKQICQVTTQGFSKKYKLTVNASDAGVGAVLLQERKDDIDLPNCYFSKTVYKDNNKLSTIEKKMTCLIVVFEIC